MKKALIVIVLLIVTVLMTPKFIGSIVEAEHQSMLEKLNENPAVTINSKTYAIDWFSGTAITEMTILLNSQAIEDIKVVVEEKLTFGPFIIADDGMHFALSHSNAAIRFNSQLIDDEINEFINDKIQLTSLLTFSKDIISFVTIDAISKEVDGNFIVSSKATGQFTFENNKKIYGDFHWGGLEAKTKDESVILGETTFDLDQTIIAGDYYQGNAISTGNFNFLISSVNAKDAMGNEALHLNNLKINAVSAVNDNLMNIAMVYSIDEVKAAGQDLKNINLDITFDQLDIKVMQDVNTMFANISVDENEMFNEQNMKKILLLTEKLLAKDPVLKINDLSVDTPEGKIESKMQVVVDKKAFDPANFMTLVAAIQANSDGKAPIEFFTKLGLTPVIDMYVEQGFLIKTDDELSFKVNFSQGQLQVNGQVIPL
ncbi:MAG: YdgA family protein [Colwellia sp.]